MRSAICVPIRAPARSNRVRCRSNQPQSGSNQARRQSNPARSLAGAHLGEVISKPVWTRSSAALSSPP